MQKGSVVNSPVHIEWDKAAEGLGKIPIEDERVRYAVAIKPLLKLPKTSFILEAGCGAGRLLRALDALGYQNTVGIEISDARLREVVRLGPKTTRLVCTDQVPFVPASFDAVVSTGVIEHVTDPQAWLADLTRVVRSGGLLAITSDTYMWRWLTRLGLYRSIQPIDDAIWPGALIRWGHNLGLDILGSGGFVNTSTQRYYLVKQLLRFVPKSGRLQSWLDRGPAPDNDRDETGAILEAAEGLEKYAHPYSWARVWSYESYYWFRKR